MIETRTCGAIHPEAGDVCLIPVFIHPRKCECGEDRVSDHKQPHEAVNQHGVIIRRWETIIVVKDLPFNAYRPWEG